MSISFFPRCDDQLINLHAKGLTWEDIASYIGCSRSAAKNRGLVLGLTNVHMSNKGSMIERARQSAEKLRELPKLQDHLSGPGISTLPLLPSLQMPLPTFSQLGEKKERR